MLALCCLITINGCSYLDVVPDNVATLDNAFALRSTAERYLFTCYSYVPLDASIYTGTPALAGGDEIWFYESIEGVSVWNIARGGQNVVNPYMNFWDGLNGGRANYRGIRECNIFLENIQNVPDMDDFEKRRWAAEAKFLKAYYHFWLLRMYGPIPLIDKNLPVSANTEEVKVTRRPFDECVDFIVQLIDEAIEDLPMRIEFQVEEMGRVTKSAALAIKARVLVMAASPLFNGNWAYENFTSKQGDPLFSATYDPSKWERAASACKEAIEAAHGAGHALYYFNDAFLEAGISDITRYELNIRAALSERWNPEIIWGNANSRVHEIQSRAQPRFFSSEAHLNATESTLAPPIKMAELFYSKNGVPIEEDIDFNYTGRYNLRKAASEDRLYIREGVESINLHFDREPRFYASLAFDGGRWYGQGRFNEDDNFYVDAKAGGIAAGHVYKHSATGYWPKKMVNFRNVASTNGYTIQNYPFPIVRMSDLYLLYAEALNEVGGMQAEALKWIDLVRERAGLPGVKTAWENHSVRADKFNSQDGLREIIQQERLIELAFEGHRFWDLRRWKKAEEELNKPITGWDITQSEPEAYYRPRILFNQSFVSKDYLWPIREQSLLVNPNLVQNPGW